MMCAMSVRSCVISDWLTQAHIYKRERDTYFAKCARITSCVFFYSIATTIIYCIFFPVCSQQNFVISNHMGFYYNTTICRNGTLMTNIWCALLYVHTITHKNRNDSNTQCVNQTQHCTLAQLNEKKKEMSTEIVASQMKMRFFSIDVFGCVWHMPHHQEFRRISHSINNRSQLCESNKGKYTHCNMYKSSSSSSDAT